ncbi:MAG: helix-turn-helix domain-containing protein [Gammaproteobacteria bacterium]|nr:helix-turn-helix domain-containing protein [Gammaproteobacteria bacterium]
MIRSLGRGLEVLSLLNKRDSASAAELARDLDAPRASIYRILHTLQAMGYIYQHPSDNRFRIKLKVRELSDGFTDEDHMANVSHPYLSRITRKFSWPVTLATISGINLIVRENTDQESPLANERFTIGYRMPLLRTASGRCILAHMPKARRTVVLETLAESDPKFRSIVRQPVELEKAFRKIRADGYSINHRSRRLSDLTAISVPILTAPRVVRGAVTIRYARTAMKSPEAIRRFLPDLQDTAGRISHRIKLHIERQQGRDN